MSNLNKTGYLLKESTRNVILDLWYVHSAFERNSTGFTKSFTYHIMKQSISEMGIHYVTGQDLNTSIRIFTFNGSVFWQKLLEIDITNHYRQHLITDVDRSN